jgi:uncharacterized protein
MDHVVAAELAWASAHAGHPSLRFNHRGVGASQGVRGEGPAQLEDAAAALALLRENLGSPEVVIVSLGLAWETALSLSQGDSHIRGLAFVAPAGGALARWKQRTCPLCVVAAAEDPRIDSDTLEKACEKAQATLEWVEGADSQFRRNLPQVGRAVLKLLERVS